MSGSTRCECTKGSEGGTDPMNTRYEPINTSGDTWTCGCAVANSTLNASKVCICNTGFKTTAYNSVGPVEFACTCNANGY